MNSAGESKEGKKWPFSKFADEETLEHLFGGNVAAESASLTTVTNVIVLPFHTNKKTLKSYLREKLFAGNHDIRSVLYKRLIKRVECNEGSFDRSMYNDFVLDNLTPAGKYKKLPFPSFVGKESFPLYCLNAEGECVLSVILACIHYHFPEITYSPLLPMATVMLLLYDDDPGQVFSHVCRLIFANSRHCQYLDITEEANAASAKVLRDLSQRYTAGSHKSLLNLTTTPDEVYSQWLRCLFNGLPFTFIVVLFDMYLLEGYKALYRVSLAIMRFYRKSGVSNPENIMDTVLEFVSGIEAKVSMATLFRKAFNFKLPSSKEISKLHRAIMSKNRREFSQLPRTQVVRSPWRYTRVVKDCRSEIVDEQLMASLYCWLPELYAEMRPTKIFSTNNDGYYLPTFYNRLDDHSPTIILIKTTDEEVLGAFCSDSWQNRQGRSFFGTGQTFVFTLKPRLRIYQWVMVSESEVMPQLDQPQEAPLTLPLINNLSKDDEAGVTSSDSDSAAAMVLPSLTHTSSTALPTTWSSTCINDDTTELHHAGGTFEDMPCFDQQLSTSSSVVEESGAKADFSKDNLPTMYDDDWSSKERRFSTAVPDDSPLTTAIENIFDSSRRTSLADDVVADDVIANDAVANEAVTNDAVADDVVADDVVTSDVVADDLVTSDVVADDVELEADEEGTDEVEETSSSLCAIYTNDEEVPNVSRGPCVEDEGEVKKMNDLFMMADDSGIFVGGGGGGYAIFVDASFHRGTSQPCATFNNPPLVSSLNGFTCACVEVFAFTSSPLD